jgi:VCBS repeat-containing protein
VNVPTFCATATVTVDVDALPNHDPVLGDVVRTTIVGFPVAGTLVASDPDPGQTLTYSLVGAATHGTATVTAAGGYLYTHSDTYVGNDSFTVQVCDDAPTPGCTTAEVTIRRLPLALPDLEVIAVDGSVALDPRTNDLGDLAPATVLSQPAHGTAAVTGAELRYTADANFSGLDSFRYRVCGTGVPTYCTQSRVFVIVRPILVPDEETTWANTRVRADVEANDLGTLDPPKIIRGARHGTATVGHSIDYVPDRDYTGYDRVTYSRCSTGAALVCGVTTLTIRVLPLLNDDVATTTENTAVTMRVTHNDEGAAGPPTIVSPPANGTAIVQADGTVVYVPTPGFVGVDVYTYQRCSANAPDLCS